MLLYQQYSKTFYLLQLNFEYNCRLVAGLTQLTILPIFLNFSIHYFSVQLTAPRIAYKGKICYIIKAFKSSLRLFHRKRAAKAARNLRGEAYGGNMRARYAKEPYRRGLRIQTENERPPY
jgi:hypothetical protein